METYNLKVQGVMWRGDNLEEVITKLPAIKQSFVKNETIKKFNGETFTEDVLWLKTNFNTTQVLPGYFLVQLPTGTIEPIHHEILYSCKNDE